MALENNILIKLKFYFGGLKIVKQFCCHINLDKKFKLLLFILVL